MLAYLSVSQVSNAEMFWLIATVTWCLDTSPVEASLCSKDQGDQHTREVKLCSWKLTEDGAVLCKRLVHNYARLF